MSRGTDLFQAACGVDLQIKELRQLEQVSHFLCIDTVLPKK